MTKLSSNQILKEENLESDKSISSKRSIVRSRNKLRESPIEKKQETSKIKNEFEESESSYYTSSYTTESSSYDTSSNHSYNKSEENLKTSSEVLEEMSETESSISSHSIVKDAARRSKQRRVFQDIQDSSDTFSKESVDVINESEIDNNQGETVSDLPIRALGEAKVRDANINHQTANEEFPIKKSFKQRRSKYDRDNLNLGKDISNIVKKRESSKRHKDTRDASSIVSHSSSKIESIYSNSESENELFSQDESIIDTRLAIPLESDLEYASDIDSSDMTGEMFDMNNVDILSYQKKRLSKNFIKKDRKKYFLKSMNPYYPNIVTKSTDPNVFLNGKCKFTWRDKEFIPIPHHPDCLRTNDNFEGVNMCLDTNNKQSSQENSLEINSPANSDNSCSQVSTTNTDKTNDDDIYHDQIVYSSDNEDKLKKPVGEKLDKPEKKYSSKNDCRKKLNDRRLTFNLPKRQKSTKSRRRVKGENSKKNIKYAAKNQSKQKGKSRKKVEKVLGDLNITKLIDKLFKKTPE